MNVNEKHLLAALTNNLDSSVPPTERIKILTAMVTILLYKANLDSTAEKNFVEHLSIATFGSSDELAEHKECFTVMKSLANVIVMSKMFEGLANVPAAEATEIPDFEFPKEVGL